jgi:hypothetical protein
MGSGCIDPCNVDRGTSWRCVVIFTHRPLYPRGKMPRYPLSRRLRAWQSRSGRRGEEKILDRTETRNSDPSAVQPVASRYTDCAIPTPRWKYMYIELTTGILTMWYINQEVPSDNHHYRGLSCWTLPVSGIKNLPSSCCTPLVLSVPNLVSIKRFPDSVSRQYS